jgi:hypothetical protein
VEPTNRGTSKRTMRNRRCLCSPPRMSVLRAVFTAAMAVGGGDPLGVSGSIQDAPVNQEK